MPPRAVRRPSTASALKKKPHHHHQSSPPPKEEKEEKNFVPGEADRSERLELEDYPQSEAEEDAPTNVEMEEDAEMDGWGEEEGGEDRIGGDDMMEGEEEEGEEEVGDEDIRDEHGEEVDGFEEEHHDVVKERRKRKEFEVFVGGLDRDATEEDLREVFGQVGEITELRLLRNPVTQKNKGFAFLRFATVEQARRAVNELKHPVVNGKQCGVAPSQDSDTLFVGNICKTWTKESLKEKLAHYRVDNYEDLTLVEDTKNEGLNRGFAFLDFSSRADAVEACKRLQMRDIVFGTDRTARVAFADTFIEPNDEIMSQVRTIFLDGLPPTWDEDRVVEHLKKFGRIEKVELARNMPAAKRNDFGFITFDNHDAAVACVDGINNTELGDGDKKVKVRARLSRPRQRGKLAKHARGGYPVGYGSDRGGRAQWNSSMSRMDSWRLTGRSGRSLQSHRTYDGGLRPSLGHSGREPVMVPNKIASRRQFLSPERSFSRRSPVAIYGKSSSKRDYMRQDDFSRQPDFARTPTERRSYRDAYSSRGSGYLEAPLRSVSRGAARRQSPVYDDDSYGRYVERLPSYRDGHGRDYSSIASSKRSYSAIEEVPSHYAESSIRQSRARFDYGGSSSGLPYSDSSYGSDSTRLGRGSRVGYDGGSRSSAGHSHRLYDTSRSSTGYRRDEISREDLEGMYSSYDGDYVSRDYMPTRSDLGAGSYPSEYPSRHMNDGYSSGRGSRSYY